MSPITLCILLVSIFSPGFAITRNVTTSADFEKALNLAEPGDVILILSENSALKGRFIARANGGEDAPIKIKGPCLIDAEDDVGLTVAGDFWSIEDLYLLNSKPIVGVLISGNNNTLKSIIITGAEKGLQITGHNNVLKDSMIHSSNGTGLLISGSNNTLVDNVVRGHPAVELEKGSCCGLVQSGVTNGNVLVEGSKHVLKEVVINGNLTVSGCENTLSTVISSAPPHLTSDCDNYHQEIGLIRRINMHFF